MCDVLHCFYSLTVFAMCGLSFLQSDPGKRGKKKKKDRVLPSFLCMSPQTKRQLLKATLDMYVRNVCVFVHIMFVLALPFHIGLTMTYFFSLHQQPLRCALFDKWFLYVPLIPSIIWDFQTVKIHSIIILINSTFFITYENEMKEDLRNKTTNF